MQWGIYGAVELAYEHDPPFQSLSFRCVVVLGVVLLMCIGFWIWIEHVLCAPEQMVPLTLSPS